MVANSLQEYMHFVTFLKKGHPVLFFTENNIFFHVVNIMETNVLRIQKDRVLSRIFLLLFYAVSFLPTFSFGTLHFWLVDFIPELISDELIL